MLRRLLVLTILVRLGHAGPTNYGNYQTYSIHRSEGTQIFSSDSFFVDSQQTNPQQSSQQHRSTSNIRADSQRTQTSSYGRQNYPNNNQQNVKKLQILFPQNYDNKYQNWQYNSQSSYSSKPQPTRQPEAFRPGLVSTPFPLIHPERKPTQRPSYQPSTTRAPFNDEPSNDNNNENFLKPNDSSQLQHTNLQNRDQNRDGPTYANNNGQVVDNVNRNSWATSRPNNSNNLPQTSLTNRGGFDYSTNNEKSDSSITSTRPTLVHKKDENPILTPNEMHAFEIVPPPTLSIDESLSTTTRASIFDVIKQRPKN